MTTARDASRTSRVPPTSRTVAVGAAALVIAAASCSSDEPFAGSDIAPTDTPSASPTSIAVPPVGSRVVDDAEWSIAVPAQWEEARRALGEDGEIARWSEPSPSGPSRAAVSVVVDRSPAAPLLEQSYRLEQRLRESQIIPVRSAVTWPGSETPGVLVQWAENSRGDEMRREVWQLFVQGPRKTILNVVGYAPADDFATSQVPGVMGTFALTD
ncbi:MAG: hypothetical protein ACRCXL_13200 [Dermatophilaceae bacterium]